MNEKLDSISEASIKQLVDNFYIKVRKDELLKPVFENAIGKTNSEWQPHLEVMYSFWSSLMLTSGKYHGSPMQKHKALPAFDKKLFDRWLKLFEQTTKEIHTAQIAAKYKEKSERVASSLKMALYYKPEDLINRLQQ